MNKVFVYGSLLSGMGNHSILGDSKLLGKAQSPAGFTMLDLGAFPGVIKLETSGGMIIMGEVYEVDDKTMVRLDRLEGYNPSNPSQGFYNRIKINTEFGKAYMYTVNTYYAGGRPIVENGDWRSHYNLKHNKY